MSWPSPYFVVDQTPATKLELINSCSPVTLHSPAKGEIKDGTLLIGKGCVWYRNSERTLFKLIVMWSRPPELHASMIRLNPRIDIFVEAYSRDPDFIFYFADHKTAHAAHASLVECAKHPPPPPSYASVAKPTPAPPAIMGVARIVESEKRKIEEDKKLTSEAFSDLSELMKRASEVTDLIKRCAESLSSQKDMDEFDKLLADIGVVNNPVTRATAGKKYHEELAKQIASFLTQRKPPAVVLTLADVYALYNKARAGADLVSPSDCLAACKLMSSLELGFEYLEYGGGVKAIKNKRFYLDIEKACKELIARPNMSLSAADLVKAVPNLPLVIAKEWLVEKENQQDLVRDKDQYGNLRWFPNLFTELKIN